MKSKKLQIKVKTNVKAGYVPEELFDILAGDGGGEFYDQGQSEIFGDRFEP